jgi:hypothetical protein
MTITAALLMKLRALVIGLLLANVLVAGWFVGVESTAGREPERVQQQVRPQAVRVVPRGADRPSGTGGASRASGTLGPSDASPSTPPARPIP